MRGNHTLVFPSLSPSLPVCLKRSKIKSFKKIKEQGEENLGERGQGGEPDWQRKRRNQKE